LDFGDKTNLWLCFNEPKTHLQQTKPNQTKPTPPKTTIIMARGPYDTTGVIKPNAPKPPKGKRSMLACQQ
jgi:hypothetical protein